MVLKTLRRRKTFLEEQYDKAKKDTTSDILDFYEKVYVPFSKENPTSYSIVVVGLNIYI